MTTKLIIINAGTSNDDVHIDNFNVSADSAIADLKTQPTTILRPGEKYEQWMSTGQRLDIRETWPTKKPAPNIVQKGAHADDLIRAEVAVQDKMWGDANERADATKGQLLAAAMAQAQAIHSTMFFADEPGGREGAFEIAKANYYPSDWTGFRDYGSDIANLVVAAAYLRNEIKRRLAAGESFERAKRQQPYTGDQPTVSSAEAGA